MPLITNVMGSTASEVGQLVEAIDARAEVAAIELNVSCPNVKTGLDIGADPDSLAALLRDVRPLTTKPLIVKLTPNTADVAAVALAAEAEGADAVSLINTLRASALHPGGGGRLWLGGGTGGLSGPAIRCIALAQIAIRRSPGSRPDRRNGRCDTRHARPRSAIRGRNSGRRRDRELPGSGSGHPNCKRT